MEFIFQLWSLYVSFDEIFVPKYLSDFATDKPVYYVDNNLKN
jgi:hypothetical protein